MKYVVDITQEQAQTIRKLINEGKYKNFAQFILNSIENQIYIENQMQDEPNFEENIQISNITLKGIKSDKGTKSYKDEINLTNIKNNPICVSTPSFSDLGYSTKNDVSEDNTWIWGQVNRILPIKIGLRVLLAIIKNEQWILLEEFSKTAANYAANLGTYLRVIEDKKNISRENRISTGLPDINSYKSIMRYKSHFLAYIRKDNKYDGAMPYLKFVNLKKTDKGTDMIGMTKHGLSFAKFENPVIDLKDYTQSLSNQEIEFYLYHASQNVKGEYNAINWLLDTLKTNPVNREGINDLLKEEYGSIWQASVAVINTQRSGLMARMFELNLIEKEKQGITVKYNITSFGEKFFQNKSKLRKLNHG